MKHKNVVIEEIMVYSWLGSHHLIFSWKWIRFSSSEPTICQKRIQINISSSYLLFMSESQDYAEKWRCRYSIFSRVRV